MWPSCRNIVGEFLNLIGYPKKQTRKSRIVLPSRAGIVLLNEATSWRVEALSKSLNWPLYEENICSYYYVVTGVVWAALVGGLTCNVTIVLLVEHLVGDVRGCPMKRPVFPTICPALISFSTFSRLSSRVLIIGRYPRCPTPFLFQNVSSHIDMGITILTQV